MVSARATISVVVLFLAPAVFAVTSHARAGASSETGVIRSFDGTPIVYTLHVPANASGTEPVPVVLRTHGWAGSRDPATNPTVAALLDAGYAVMTWDSRGFGQSGGKVELDAPEFEVRDVSAILDWLEAREDIAKDRTGVVAGMSGVSYAGGIQLLSSALDPRIDAIAPEITWNDLRYSLYPNGVLKQQWVDVLFGAGLGTGTANGLVPGNPAGPQAESYDTNLPTWYAESQTIAALAPPDDVLAGLYDRSAVKFAHHLATPALLMQGFPDTLFTVNEALANYRAISAHADAKLILFCGGHAGCPYNSTGERAHLDASIVTWFDAHLKHASVDTGAPVEYYSSDNVLRFARAFPLPNTRYAHARGHAVLASTPAPLGGASFTFFGSVPGSPPQPAPMPSLDPTGVTSFRIPVSLPDGAEVTGVPRVAISARSPVHETGDAFLAFRLVDASTNVVVDGQVTPWRFVPGTTQLDLSAVSYVLPEGHALALEVSTSDAAFGPSHVPAAMEVQVEVDVPVVGA